MYPSRRCPLALYKYCSVEAPETASVLPISPSRRNPTGDVHCDLEANGRLFGTSRSYSANNHHIEPLSPTHIIHTRQHPTNNQGTLIMYLQIVPPNAAQPSEALPHSNPEPPYLPITNMYTLRSEKRSIDREKEWGKRGNAPSDPARNESLVPEDKRR